MGNGDTVKTLGPRGNRQDRPPGGRAPGRPAACRYGSARASVRRRSTGRSTWAPALEWGVGAVYVSHYLDALPCAAQTVGSFADLAVRSVPRLVLLSGRGEPEAERVEQAVRDSGAEPTIVRSTWFAQNFEDGWREPVLSGEIALPAGDTPEPFGRRRRHRRRRGGGADRGRTRGPGLRADRAAATDV